VLVDHLGYARHVSCEKGHAGNRRYVRALSGWWQCQGCNDFVAAGVLLERQGRSYAVDGHCDLDFGQACGTAAALSVVSGKTVCVETRSCGRIVERLYVSTTTSVSI